MAVSPLECGPQTMAVVRAGPQGLPDSTGARHPLAVPSRSESIVRRAGCVSCARPDLWEPGVGNDLGRPDIKRRWAPPMDAEEDASHEALLVHAVAHPRSSVAPTFSNILRTSSPPPGSPHGACTGPVSSPRIVVVPPAQRLRRLRRPRVGQGVPPIRGGESTPPGSSPLFRIFSPTRSPIVERSRGEAGARRGPSSGEPRRPGLL